MRAALLLLGCLEAHPPDGYFRCAATEPRCPRGYQCAADDTCRSGGGGVAPGLALLAGGVGGPGTANGPGSGARFAMPVQIASDGAGHLYLPDEQSRTVRRFDVATGEVSTVAGSPDDQTAMPRDGMGADARFQAPWGIAWADGDLYVSDGPQLRRIQLPSARVSTVPVTLMFARGLAFDSGFLYIAEAGRHVISKLQLANLQLTVVAGTPMMPYPMGLFVMPSGLAFHQGVLYVTDPPLAAVMRVQLPGGQVTVAAGTLMMPGFADGANARFSFLGGIVSDGGSYLFVSDSSNHLLRRIEVASGIVSSPVGQPTSTGDVDGTGAEARLFGPMGVAWAGGAVFISEGGNHTLRRFDGQMVTTVAGRALHEGYAEDVGAAARFRGPTGAAADDDGNLYVADTNNYVIRRLQPNGMVSLLAGGVGRPGTGDGIGADASFSAPRGLACDGKTYLYVADSGNGLIRRIELQSRKVTTIAGGGSGSTPDGVGSAARFAGPVSLALDGDKLFVAESTTIRQVMLAGAEVTTLAGGPMIDWIDGTGPAALFNQPSAVAADGKGNLFIADTYNHVIRQLEIATRKVTTFAGAGKSPGSNDGDLRAAHFSFPAALVFDKSGALLVADGNHTLRKISGGKVTTVAGVAGESGILVGPLPGRLHSPAGLALLPDGVAVTSQAENAVLVLR